MSLIFLNGEVDKQFLKGRFIEGPSKFHKLYLTSPKNQDEATKILPEDLSSSGHLTRIRRGP